MRIDSKVSDIDGLELELLDFGKLILPDSIDRWISSCTKRGKREGKEGLLLVMKDLSGLFQLNY